MLTVADVSVVRGKRKTLNSLSFSLQQRQSLAVVGESGAGKSTLIAAVLGFVRLSGGTIDWNSGPVSTCRPALVLQEPRSAFNPALTLRQSVMEPVMARRLSFDETRFSRLCGELGLQAGILDRRPGEVSIGQAQRIGILRALMAEPQLILFDEPLSALDAVSQKSTARLIATLQSEEGFAALIVTHDLGYAAAFADRIAVLRSGRIEELSPALSFIETPQTDYGRKLRDAAFSLGALARVA